MDVLLKDVDTCYANVDVALRRNEVDQVSSSSYDMHVSSSSYDMWP
jgi:hypothetical protein